MRDAKTHTEDRKRRTSGTAASTTLADLLEPQCSQNMACLPDPWDRNIITTSMYGPLPMSGEARTCQPSLTTTVELGWIQLMKTRQQE